MKFKFSVLANERGVIMVTTLLLVAMIAIFATSLFARTIGEKRQIEMQTNRIIAFQMAEAAVDDAIFNLATNSNYSGTNGQFINLGASGGYSSTVTQPDSANNPNVRQIIAIGSAPGNTLGDYAYQARTVTTYVQLAPQSLFSHAVFTQDKITMQGNAATDSYNSSAGPYGGTNVGGNGDIGSNTTDTGDISLTGNAVVSGDAQVGVGGDPNQVIQLGDNAAITGGTSAEPANVNLEPVTVPAGLTSSGPVNLSGDTIQSLPAGTYLFDQIKISGNAKLVPDGPVTIYVTGDVDITGNGVTTAGNIPANFIVNVVGQETVKISGNGTFYGVIYAPESGKNSDAVTITTLTGNTEIFGAIIAYEFKANGNIKVHYDDALANLGGNSNNVVSLVSWQES